MRPSALNDRQKQMRLQGAVCTIVREMGRKSVVRMSVLFVHFYNFMMSSIDIENS